MAQVNFEYRYGWLEAADPATDREWSWRKGDGEVVVSHGGQWAGVLDVPQGATVPEVKTMIRQDAKGVTGNRNSTE